MLIYAAGVLREMKRDRRRARRAVHRRRGDDRLGPHRHAVRLRAGRHLARHPLPGQGPDRRLAAAGGDAVHSRRSSRRTIRRTAPRRSSTLELYTANPIACAAAVANLEIWRDEPVAERIAALAARQAERLAPFRADPALRQSCASSAPSPRSTCTSADAGYLAGVGPRSDAVLPRAGRAAAPARQHHLRHAALLHHGRRARRAL